MVSTRARLRRAPFGRPPGDGELVNDTYGSVPGHEPNLRERVLEPAGLRRLGVLDVRLQVPVCLLRDLGDD